jgi:ribosomal protein S18 acetylase RimI-like enzyme
MSSLVIRPALIEDIPSIVEVRLGAFTEEESAGFTIPEESPYTSVGRLYKVWKRGNLFRDGSEVFVAEREGKVIGFIVYNMRSLDDNIDNVVVAKEEQGKGVGKALVEYVERLAESRGYHVMRIDTTENAEGVPWKAYGFWRKMGFKDSGERVATEYGFKDIPLIKKLNTRKRVKLSKKQR